MVIKELLHSSVLVDYSGKGYFLTGHSGKGHILKQTQCKGGSNFKCRSHCLGYVQQSFDHASVHCLPGSALPGRVSAYTKLRFCHDVAHFCLQKMTEESFLSILLYFFYCYMTYFPCIVGAQMESFCG